MQITKALIEEIKKDQNRYSLANLVTVSRLVFIPFILYNLSRSTLENDRWAALFMFLAGTTDFFDGYFARKYDQRSYLGKILDPIADKLSIGVVMVFLSIYNQLPLWYTFVVIGRDVLILSGSVFVFASKSILSQSNLLGKWTLTSFVLVVLAYTLHLFPWAHYLMWLSTILIPLSVVGYIYYYLRKIKNVILD